MSIEAKQYLIQQFEEDMEPVLTVRNLKLAKSSLNDVLNNYSIERLESDECDNSVFSVLEVFLKTKTLEGRSKLTVERYRYVLTRMFLQIHVPLKQITVVHLREYLLEQKKYGIADTTLESLRQVICGFFNWMFNERYIDINPALNLNKIKCAKKVRPPYSDVEIEELKEACMIGHNARYACMDKALIATMLTTGCRISEICTLNRNDIDFNAKECTVLGKGNKERTVFLDDVTCALLKRYLDSRTDFEEALFIGKRGERLTPGGVRYRLRVLAKESNIENVHPHRFRRTFATNLINHGMQIQDVASILGHEKLDTTMRYVYIDKSNVKNAYHRYL